MAIPAFIGDAHIGMALVTEFSLVGVAIHTGAIQTHDIFLVVARLIGPHTISDDRGLPILQKCFMIDPNEGLRFNALFLGLIHRKFRLGNIIGFSAHRIMPNRIGDQPKKEDQPQNNFLPIIHGRVFPPHPPLSPLGERER